MELDYAANLTLGGRYYIERQTYSPYFEAGLTTSLESHAQEFQVLPFAQLNAFALMGLEYRGADGLNINCSVGGLMGYAVNQKEPAPLPALGLAIDVSLGYAF